MITKSLFMVVMSSYKTRLKMLKELNEYKQAASIRRSNDNTLYRYSKIPVSANLSSSSQKYDALQVNPIYQ
ncbi:hypothetical protein ACTXT7_005404 [Hymenolepis weldensis]